MLNWVIALGSWCDQC